MGTADTNAQYDQAAEQATADSGDVTNSAPGQSVEGAAGQSPQNGQSDTQSWDGKSWALKFRDREVIPESRNHLMTWAQKGYAYNTLKADLDKREEQLRGLESELGEYRKLNEAFQNNPNFKQRILQLYQETVSGIRRAEAQGDK